MPPTFERHTVTLVKASITDVFLPSVVGPSFTLAGGARVVMRERTVTKQRGQGTTTESEGLVSDGFKVFVKVNSLNTEVTPVPQADGSLRWSHNVTGAKAGQKLDIAVRLVGKVEESDIRFKDGEPDGQPRFTIRNAEAEAQFSTRVDSTPPEIAAVVKTITKGPPYLVTLTGHTTDSDTRVERVFAEFDGSEVTAQNLAGSFAAWEVHGALPDRTTAHTIRVTAVDIAGNKRTTSVNIESDQQGPRVVVEDPRETVVFPLVGSTLAVSGVAVDTESAISAVRWQVDDGPLRDANAVGGDFQIWELEAEVETSEIQILSVTATDAAGNVSVPVTLEVRPVTGSGPRT